LSVPVQRFDLAEAALTLGRLRAGKIRGRAVVTAQAR
jgi:hypothetical protein